MTDEKKGSEGPLEEQDNDGGAARAGLDMGLNIFQIEHPVMLLAGIVTAIGLGDWMIRRRHRPSSP